MLPDSVRVPEPELVTLDEPEIFPEKVLVDDALKIKFAASRSGLNEPLPVIEFALNSTDEIEGQS